MDPRLSEIRAFANHMNTTEVRVKGKAVSVPSAQIQGRTVLAGGKWIEIAAVQDEELIIGETTTDPESFIAELKESGFHADIFTFAQRIPNTSRMPCTSIDVVRACSRGEQGSGRWGLGGKDRASRSRFPSCWSFPVHHCRPSSSSSLPVVVLACCHPQQLLTHCCPHCPPCPVHLGGTRHMPLDMDLCR